MVFFLDSYRIIVGNKTCVFEKEKDPTVLRSPSAGKLLQYVIEDGGHIFAGETYAEIEVIVMDYDKSVLYKILGTRVQIGALVSGDENGYDSDSSGVWLYSLCEETRSRPSNWLCCGPYGAR